MMKQVLVFCFFLIALNAVCPGTNNNPGASVDNGPCCAHSVSEGVKYTPTTKIRMDDNNPIVYFDSINCQNSDKTNMKFEIDADDVNASIISSKSTFVVCFGKDDNQCPDQDDSGNVKCYKTGSLGSNDGIMSGVGVGDNVWSVAREDGDDDLVDINNIKFTCTDKEGTDAAKIGILVGIVVAVLIMCTACCALMYYKKKSQSKQEIGLE